MVKINSNYNPIFCDLGSVNLHRCTLQRLIPIWLVVSGASLAFQQISAIVSRINNLCCRYGLTPSDQSGWNSLETSYGVFNTIFACFNFAWFIAGKCMACDCTNTFSTVACRIEGLKFGNFI